MIVLFKDLYKQANDKIDTSPARQRVMDNLFTQSHKKQRKSYNFQYVAAMAACAALTFAGIGLYNENNTDTPTEIAYIQREIKQNDISNNIQKDDIIVEDNAMTENQSKVQSDINIHKSSEKTNQQTEKKEQKTVTDKEFSSSEVSAENSVPFEESAVLENPQTSSENNDISEPAPAAEVGGIASLSLHSGDDIHISDGITDKIALPDGMEYKNSSSRSVNENIEYIFSGNDKYIKITNSDVLPDVGNYTEYKTADSTVIYSKDNIFTAYLKSDLNYIIYSENLTYSEFEQLINSLK